MVSDPGCSTWPLFRNRSDGLPGFLKKTQTFVEEVQVEMRRVTWPDREQLRNATFVILVFVLILAAIIGLMDTVFSWLVRTIVNLFGG